MTTIEALGVLYTALGGSADDYNVDTIPEAIALIATVATPAELPAVTTSNNGQILTVVSGKWEAANAPTELPTVSATDNGSVLKVIEGAWGVGEDATE